MSDFGLDCTIWCWVPDVSEFVLDILRVTILALLLVACCGVYVHWAAHLSLELCTVHAHQARDLSLQAIQDRVQFRDRLQLLLQLLACVP